MKATVKTEGFESSGKIVAENLATGDVILDSNSHYLRILILCNNTYTEPGGKRAHLTFMRYNPITGDTVSFYSVLVPHGTEFTKVDEVMSVEVKIKRR